MSQTYNQVEFGKLFDTSRGVPDYSELSYTEAYKDRGLALTDSLKIPAKTSFKDRLENVSLVLQAYEQAYILSIVQQRNESEITASTGRPYQQVLHYILDPETIRSAYGKKRELLYRAFLHDERHIESVSDRYRLKNAERPHIYSTPRAIADLAPLQLKDKLSLNFFGESVEACKRILAALKKKQRVIFIMEDEVSIDDKLNMIELLQYYAVSLLEKPITFALDYVTNNFVQVFFVSRVDFYDLPEYIVRSAHVVNWEGNIEIDANDSTISDIFDLAYSHGNINTIDEALDQFDRVADLPAELSDIEAKKIFMRLKEEESYRTSDEVIDDLAELSHADYKIIVDEFNKDEKIDVSLRVWQKNKKIDILESGIAEGDWRNKFFSRIDPATIEKDMQTLILENVTPRDISSLSDDWIQKILTWSIESGRDDLILGIVANKKKQFTKKLEQLDDQKRKDLFSRLLDSVKDNLQSQSLIRIILELNYDDYSNVVDAKLFRVKVIDSKIFQATEPTGSQVEVFINIMGNTNPTVDDKALPRPLLEALVEHVTQVDDSKRRYVGSELDHHYAKEKSSRPISNDELKGYYELVESLELPSTIKAIEFRAMYNVRHHPERLDHDQIDALRKIFSNAPKDDKFWGRFRERLEEAQNEHPNELITDADGLLDWYRKGSKSYEDIVSLRDIRLDNPNIVVKLMNETDRYGNREHIIRKLEPLGIFGNSDIWKSLGTEPKKAVLNEINEELVYSIAENTNKYKHAFDDFLQHWYDDKITISRLGIGKQTAAEMFNAILWYTTDKDEALEAALFQLKTLREQIDDRQVKFDRAKPELLAAYLNNPVYLRDVKSILKSIALTYECDDKKCERAAKFYRALSNRNQKGQTYTIVESIVKFIVEEQSKSNATDLPDSPLNRFRYYLTQSTKDIELEIFSLIRDIYILEKGKVEKKNYWTERYEVMIKSLVPYLSVDQKLKLSREFRKDKYFLEDLLKPEFGMQLAAELRNAFAAFFRE